MNHICQSSLPVAPWLEQATRRLPGIQPLRDFDWITRDEVFAEQMALRDHLLATRREEVFDARPEALPAARELLAMVLDRLGPGYTREGGHVTRPDGVRVTLSGDHPLVCAARLVQEDLCLLMQDEGQGEHILKAAVLCFPASWSLSEKMGHPLTTIHIPVEIYQEDLARRVQRLFDALHPDRPLWRANALLYSDPALFQPRRFGEQRKIPEGQPPFLRSERQCMVRLPKTRAALFSIHTWVVAWEDLTDAQREGLKTHPIHHVKAAQ